MKKIKLSILSLLAITALVFTSCSNDDDAPAPVNEEEVITTITVTLTPAGGGDVITLQSRDVDGEGGNAPVVTVSGPLAANTTYNGSIKLLNETESPAEDITEEVEEEDDEHQFFYIVGGLNLTTTYTSFDDNNNPLGTTFNAMAGATSNGTITFILRHEPTKPNTGVADAGGSTDIQVTFNVAIQ